MLSYNKTLGMPIIILDEGRKVGIVNEIFFNLKSNSILGIESMEAGKKNEYIRFVDFTISDDIISVQDFKSLKASSKIWGLSEGMIKGKEIVDKKVYDYKGRDLGYVCDIFLDPETGSVDAYQVTDGIVQDLMEGRKIVPTFGKTDVREEGIFVSKQAIEEIINDSRGLKALFPSEENE